MAEIDWWLKLGRLKMTSCEGMTSSNFNQPRTRGKQPRLMAHLPDADRAILKPVLVMAATTLCVWIRLFYVRIGEMNRRKIDPQAISSPAKVAALLEDTRASDNFKNLFEVPVLFYVAVAFGIMTGSTQGPFTTLAWAFVLLRAAHSFIQCTYNTVMHRFAVGSPRQILCSRLCFVLVHVLLHSLVFLAGPWATVLQRDCQVSAGIATTQSFHTHMRRWSDQESRHKERPCTGHVSCCGRKSLLLHIPDRGIHVN